MRILLVEDDALLSRMLTEHLTAQHYVVDVASDGVAGFDYAQAVPYDLIVLDVNLPLLNGIQLCQQLRQHRYTVPILLLTAKGDSYDKVMGLDAGADDYVVKPCPIEEINARIRALLRRGSSSCTPILSWGNLNLDPVTCEVTCDGHPLGLSPKEYSLLELFLRHPQRTFSSGSILEHLWSFEDAPGEETVRSHIKRLRRKLKACGSEDMIDTVYGMGYRLKAAPDEIPPLATAPPHAPAAAPSASSLEAEARRLAIASWEQFKQPTLERVAVLEQAAAALATGTLSEELRAAAAQAAHKLAGSLGMFGFPAGTTLGWELEQLWQTMPPPATHSRIVTLVQELQALLHSPAQPHPTGAQAGEGGSFEPPNPAQVVLVTPETQLAHRLQAAGREQGIRLHTLSSVAMARSHLMQGTPGVLLLDDTLLAEEAGSHFLQQLADQMPKPLIVVLSDQDDFTHRLAGVRVGGDRFLVKSTPPEDIIKVVHALLNQRSPTIRVLAVDDDPVVLGKLSQCLPLWGMQLTTLKTPDALWQTLAAIQPHCVILDVEMPIANGLELCRMIRSDRKWGTLPILFLTARREPEVVLQIYEAGADDYVSKPFTDLEIVTRIFNRLARNCPAHPT